MRNSFRYTPLSAEKSCALFRQLAQLEKSGFHADKAFALIADTDKALKLRLHAIQTHIKAGKPIAEAGFKAGLFNAVQQALIHAAESGGTLATVYTRLADHYATRAQRLRKIKTQCLFPALLLIISLFLQPLPALVAADISLLQYLQLSAGKLALLAFTVYFAISLPSILNNMGLTAAFHRVQIQLPLVSGWIIKRQLNDFYHNLTLLLTAGLAFSEALPKAVAGIPNSALQLQFAPALANATTGERVTDVLLMVKSIRGPVLQVVNSSEHSGTLAKGLHHFAQLEAGNLHLQDDLLAEWLPRLVYAVIAAGIAKSLIGF